MLGLYDGFFLSGASKTSVLTERIWVTDSLCHHCILFYFSSLGGMEGRGGKDCPSPWLGVVKDSNSLRDRIYDVKGRGRYDSARRTARCQEDGPYNRGACYHMIWP